MFEKEKKNQFEFKLNIWIKISELNEEGIYRKNGVSHKINQFIEKHFFNLSASTNNSEPAVTVTNESNSNHTPSLISSIKSNILSHSSSFTTLNFLSSSSNNANSNNSNENHASTTCSSQSTLVSSSPIQNQVQIATIARNGSSNTNLMSNSSSSNNSSELEDTCTITSALKHYLIHLKEPLMTFSYNQQFLIACRKFEFLW